VAVDSEGNVYAADWVNNCLQKFTSNGVFLDAWSSYPPGNGRFYGPQGLAAGGGILYVADTDSNRILVLKEQTPSLPMLQLLLMQ
jgi:DNA-binding beta-propeller fold protein YncE